HVVGDKFNVDVAPEDGYGTYIDEMVQVVPRSSFDGVNDLAVGMQFQAQTQQAPVAVAITEIDEGEVTVDDNHPLAGAALHFAIEIVDVRAASEEEIQHGHVHVAGGHHH